MDQDKILKERKEKIVSFLKTNYSWISYIVLAVIVFIATWVRTRNLSGLRDVTTGGWTLGPDLDPFLFLRWAKEILVNGSLEAIDYMRNVPIGFRTADEVLLHPYLIVWFHKFATFLGMSGSIEQSAVFYPVFIFALTLIFFFLFVRKIFDETLGKINSNIIALISSLFLSILPSILPRTIAGIPEKEASGFLFLFVTFYLFLSAWKSKTTWSQIALAILSGIAGGCMALVWGGFIYIPLTIGISLLISLLIGQVDKSKICTSLCWIISSFIIMNLFSTRYTLFNLLTSTTTIIPIVILIVSIVHLLIFNTNLKRYFENPSLSKIPKPVISFVLTLIVGLILAVLFLGPSFVIDKFHDFTKPLISPTTDRLGVTVAENRQPYFNEWAGNFGPYVGSIPIFFWLFFIGSIYLFYNIINVFNKRERIFSTLAYTFFLIAIIFSRYSQDSRFNGVSGVSLLFYILGALVFICTLGFYYYQYHKRGDQEKLNKIDFGVLLLFSLFFFSIISARGAVRLIMVLVLPTSIITSYFLVVAVNDVQKIKDATVKMFAWLIIGLMILGAIYSAYYFYQVSVGTSQSYVPNEYTQQWQKAMAWVREDTPKNSVFAHWWDYGYWVQTMGERATVLDGGNAVGYWNYLMGRFGLTGTNDMDALEFFYTHNTTHFLIDSTDIGKYTAFSSIGSDEKNDRYSWIQPFQMDPAQTRENKNSTIFAYTGGVSLDSDIFYDLNGTKLFLPSMKAGILGVIVERSNNNNNIVSQPKGVFVYQGNQYTLPLKYAFIDGKLFDYGSGVDSGLFFMPSIIQQGQGQAVLNNGVLLYLTNRTVHSQLARLYLYNEKNPYFKLAHSEDNIIVSQLKLQNISNSDFAYYGGVRGPIRIWSVTYPNGIKSNPNYLNIDFPNDNLRF